MILVHLFTIYISSIGASIFLYSLIELISIKDIILLRFVPYGFPPPICYLHLNVFRGRVLKYFMFKPMNSFFYHWCHDYNIVKTF